jgi:hypothetical protein
MMRTRPVSWVLTLLLAVAAAVVGLVMSGSTASATTAPPWAGQDQYAVGGLTFYNAAGQVITTGSTNSAPFAAYVEGNAIPRPGLGDTKATLFGYQVQQSSPAVWSNQEQLTAGTTWPITSGPNNLKSSTYPVNTGSSFDEDLDTFDSDYPLGSGPVGYTNVLQIRLYPSGTNGVSLTYLYADLTIDSAAHTWTLLYSPPPPATLPTAPTGVTGTAGNGQVALQWTAPSSNGGAAIDGYDVKFGSSASGPWTAGPASAHSSTATTATVTGLVNDLPYYFEVAAHNSVGWSPYAVSAASVTPTAPTTGPSPNPTPTVHATTITPSMSAVTIAYGKSTSLLAVLKDDTGAVVNGTLTLQSSIDDATWTAVSNGVVSPTRTTYYRWTYAGDSTHKAATSPVAVVSVSRTVTIAKTPASIKKGKTSKIFGVVAPVAGGSATVQKLVGKNWVKVGTAAIKMQKLPNKKTAIGYVFTFHGSAKGSVSLRVVTGAVAGYVPGTSSTTTVKVTG